MGTLYVVATPIGNLGDMTLRAIEVLKRVDFIAAEDTRQTIKLLNHYDIKTKMVSYHKFNEKKRSKEIISKLEEGLNIALVSDAGTPCISDPGYILINEVRKKEIEILGIPGASALINALAISGIKSDKFSFYGFLPTDSSNLKKALAKLEKSEINTIILYESPKRILKLVEILKKMFSDSIISIFSDMTKKFERNFFGNIKDVYDIIKSDEKIEKGEYVVILEKQNNIMVEENSISLEAMIVDRMIKDVCGMKAAISKIKEQNSDIKKNDLYSASLNLKEIFNKNGH